MGRILFLLVLAGCLPSARAEVASDLGGIPPGLARVCIVRPARIANGITLEIRDNGRLVGATRGSTYSCWLTGPGDHQLASNDDDTGPTLLRAQAGRQYWLHQDVTTLDDRLHAHLDWIDDSVATEMVASCERVIVSVPGHETRADAVPLVLKP